MARQSYNPPRFSPESLIEVLREDAEEEASLPYDDGEPEKPENTTAGEAAQLIEEWHEALTQIAVGAVEPKKIATDALGMSAPRKAWGTPDKIVRNLLKPRST